MARKSRKQTGAGAQIYGDESSRDLADLVRIDRIYHAALYARLSFESEVNRERNTIETQMELLHAFVDKTQDIVAEKEYFDISKTGTDFDRAGFEDMIQDMRSGRIDCIIVKDLSRLGRNYIETGNYVERIFPFFDVRFIAVTDGYDSSKGDISLTVCLSNIFNEYYSRDLGKKVKAAMRSNWNEGKFVSGKVCYGLMKSPYDKNKLVPDSQTAPVVRKIFDWFLEGKGYNEIARMLNDQGIICPSAYKESQKTGTVPEGINCKWERTSIRKMLENRYLVGDSVHNRRSSDTFAEKKTVANPKNEWIIIPNTHEAVVSREVFDKAQKLLAQKAARTVKNPGQYKTSHLNIFANKIKCADCGYSMYLQTQNNGKTIHYICGTHHQHKDKCTSHYIGAGLVQDNVFRILHEHMAAYTKSVEIEHRQKDKHLSSEKNDVYSDEISRIQMDLRRLDARKSQLYEDYTKQLIDAEQYRGIRDQDANKEKELKKKLDDLQSYRSGGERDFHANGEWVKIIQTYRYKRKLTKDMVDAFIDKVFVGQDGSLSVNLKNGDIIGEPAEAESI